MKEWRAVRVKTRLTASVLAGLCMATGMVIAITPGASAAPAASEFPATWTTTNQSLTATGTTPSGVDVTATLTPGAAPGSLLSFGSTQGGANSFGPTGSAVIAGSTLPAYLPTTSSGGLHIAISNCFIAPCGTLTYTFSKPVAAPILYLGNQGAAEVGGGFGGPRFTTFHDSPVTLLGGGTVSYDSASSHTSNSQIVNGTTIQQANPTAAVGQLADTASCDAFFACSATNVNVAAPVTSLSFSLGYAGTGVSLDEMVAILGLTPAATPPPPPAGATVVLAKDSIGGTGTFAFTGLTNLSSTTDSVTTSTAGVAATSAQTNTVTALGSAVAITETPVSGYALSGAVCADANGAADGNTAITPTVVGTTVTIPAANVLSGAAITCTFTNQFTPPPPPPVASPSISVVKTASTTPVVKAGDPINYSFLVTNTGNVALTGVTVIDTFTAPAGPAITVSCPSTTLAATTAETCTASYRASQADIDLGSIKNTATVRATSTSGPIVASASSTATVTVFRSAPNGSPSYTASKTSDPPAGTPVYPGQTVRYAISITNNGVTTQNPSLTDDMRNVLDDATYNFDATATIGTPVFTGTALTWTNALAPGQTVTLNYSIHVKPWNQEGNHRLLNLIISAGTDGNCSVADPDGRCQTSSPIYPGGPNNAVNGGLANTGSDIVPLVVIGGLAILIGCALIFIRPKRKTA